MVDRDEKFEEALSRGASTGLPPNKPQGMLGEVGLDLRRIDEFEPTLDAGILQENDQQLRWLLMLVLYATVLASPVALWLLWREPNRSLRAKIVSTVLGLLLYVAGFIVYGVLHS